MANAQNIQAKAQCSANEHSLVSSATAEDEMDAEAVNIIGGLFPGRKVYPVYARDIIVGGGNIHCITQQIPFADKGGKI